MRRTRNRKHNRKTRKSYGNRNCYRYMTPFMVLDEEYLKEV